MTLVLISFGDKTLLIPIALFDYLAGLGFESLQVDFIKRRPRLPWNVNLWWFAFIAPSEVALFRIVKEQLKKVRLRPVNKKSLSLKLFHASKPDNRSDSTVTACS